MPVNKRKKLAETIPKRIPRRERFLWLGMDAEASNRDEKSRNLRDKISQENDKGISICMRKLRFILTSSLHNDKKGPIQCCPYMAKLIKYIALFNHRDCTSFPFVNSRYFALWATSVSEFRMESNCSDPLPTPAYLSTRPSATTAGIMSPALKRLILASVSSWPPPAPPGPDRCPVRRCGSRR